MSAQLMMMLLVGLNHAAIQHGGRHISRPLAELDELHVLDQRDGFARELPCGNALHVVLQRAQKLEQRAVSLGERVESLEVVPQIMEPIDDQSVMARLVAGLPSERELQL